MDPASASRIQRSIRIRIFFSLLIIPLLCLLVLAIDFPLAERLVCAACAALFGAAVAAFTYFDAKRAGMKVQETTNAGFAFWFNLSITVILLFFLLGSLTAPRDTRPRPYPCCYRLRDLRMIMNMYAIENEGAFPPIDNTRNNFFFEADVLYPEYLTDAYATICAMEPIPEQQNVAKLVSNRHHPRFAVGTVHPDCFTDKGFIYLGWLVTSDEEAEAFFAAYDSLSPDDFDKDIIVADGKGGSKTLHRLVFDLEQVQDRWGNVHSEISGLAAGETLDALDLFSIPIMWDRPFLDRKKFNHQGPAGGNVLYLDGHIEYVDFGEKFPMTETMARLLDERPRTPIPDCE